MRHRLAIALLLGSIIGVLLVLGCGANAPAPSGGDGQLAPSALANDDTQVRAEGTIVPGPDGLARVFVGFRQRPGAAEEAQVRGKGGVVRYTYSIVPAIAASLPPQAVDALRHNPNVAYVEPDPEAWALEDTLPWGVDRINADIVWGGADLAKNVESGRPSGSGVSVAIIDTGIDYTHPDLGGNYVGGKDFVNGDSDPMDDNRHGTHVAGIVAAMDNGSAVIGVAPYTKLYALKVLDSRGTGSYSNIAAALDWCVTNRVQVASMSLGGGSDSVTLRTACANAYTAGVLLVAAAGNSGNRNGKGDNVTYPARYDSVIAVAATDSSTRNNRASFSSTGPTVELSAPGVNILSTYPAGALGTMSGTSMACPHVTGVAALVISQGSVTGATAVRNKLDNTATDLGAAARDPLYGYGLVNAKAATDL